METYFKIIIDIIQSGKHADPEKVWRKLCAAYSAQSTSQHSLFHTPLDYLHVARECGFEEKNETSAISSLTVNLNKYFQANELNSAGQFSKLLQAFLTCYPRYIELLNTNITKNLNIKPYHLPMLSLNLSTLDANHGVADDLTQILKIIPWVISGMQYSDYEVALNFIKTVIYNEDIST